jgi:nucleotide-binding universal stress UspA family protein
MYRNILVPTDGSRWSDRAVKEAAMLAKAGGGKLILFHTVSPYPMPIYTEGMAVPYFPKDKALRDARKKANKALAAAEKRAASAGVAATREFAVSAFPHEAIVATAQKRKCDLIVMASHGRSGLSRFLLGSVAQAVLARSSVPVLVVR